MGVFGAAAPLSKGPLALPEASSAVALCTSWQADRPMNVESLSIFSPEMRLQLVRIPSREAGTASLLILAPLLCS